MGDGLHDHSLDGGHSVEQSITNSPRRGQEGGYGETMKGGASGGPFGEGFGDTLATENINVQDGGTLQPLLHNHS
jgi:hypothetical protein